jgi:hypothetical protein
LILKIIFQKKKKLLITKTPFHFLIKRGISHQGRVDAVFSIVRDWSDVFSTNNKENITKILAGRRYGRNSLLFFVCLFYSLQFVKKQFQRPCKLEKNCFSYKCLYALLVFIFKSRWFDHQNISRCKHKLPDVKH